jgi:hypothetical protein
LKYLGVAMTDSEPPEHLSDRARDLWGILTHDYNILDSAGRAILLAGLEARDRAEAARRQIETEGMVLVDRFGQAKPHPLLPAERDSRAMWLAAIKQLCLDVEPLHDGPGRPWGSTNNRPGKPQINLFERS